MYKRQAFILSIDNSFLLSNFFIFDNILELLFFFPLAVSIAIKVGMISITIASIKTAPLIDVDVYKRQLYE